VSTKHANFFQADPGGSADDVRALMERVRARVREETGVDLVPETRMVGFDDPQPAVEVDP
jgi:UDP-N-acetylmuramate dehydrogenase